MVDLVIHQISLPETQNAFDMPSIGVEWLHQSSSATGSDYSCYRRLRLVLCNKVRVVVDLVMSMAW